MRVYAFDGVTLNTLWAPEDELSAKIQTTANGFKVEHLDPRQYYELRQPPYFQLDEYALLPTGPALFSSSYLP